MKMITIYMIIISVRGDSLKKIEYFLIAILFIGGGLIIYDGIGCKEKTEIISDTKRAGAAMIE